MNNAKIAAALHALAEAFEDGESAAPAKGKGKAKAAPETVAAPAAVAPAPAAPAPEPAPVVPTVAVTWISVLPTLSHKAI